MIQLTYVYHMAEAANWPAQCPVRSWTEPGMLGEAPAIDAYPSSSSRSARDEVGASANELVRVWVPPLKKLT